jgi:hypothetical protein
MWGILILFFSSLAISAEEASSFEEKIQSDSGNYSVKVEPKKKKIEVVKVDAGKDVPPYMRIRVLRKDSRPLELRLHTLNDPKMPPTYSGKFDQWNDSHIGIELEMSFDKKTWKKIGSALKKVLP